MADGYSFIVITDGLEPDKLAKEIASIQALEIPGYEVLVVEDRGKTGQLGRLRNAGCRQAQLDHLIIVDDDLIFHDDFYRGLVEYGEDYDVLSCRVLNPDGTRYWDWKEHNGSDRLLEYDETSPLVSLTGGMTIMKSWVFDKVQWDERRGFYQMEDVDFTRRLQQASIRIAFNKLSTVTHDANYTQRDEYVYKIT